ncbi:MAG TPA: OsmC family protein [Candidatus Aquicultor sp.]|jgi:putative redox protein
MKLHVEWVDNLQFVGAGERKMTVVMDSLPEHGGEGAGFRPTELLLLSLAGCTAIDIISILEKQHHSVTSFSVEVEGIQQDQYPKRFTQIELTYRITGDSISESALKRAIELSEEKYCSVRATLLNAPKIESRYEVVP